MTWDLRTWDCYCGEIPGCGQITFHGAVDEQHVLPFGSKEEVEAEVRLRLRAMAQGGGYILAPSHYVQADTPPGNLVAMCRAGRYPIAD